MAAPCKQQFTAALRFAEFAAVDSATGIIRGVSVITEGPALGHGMMIDSETLAQVKACAETYTGGLKVKLNHGSDVGAIVGFLRDFRLDGIQLKADLHLLDSSPSRAYVLEIAAKIPDTFGLSISFSGPTDERNGEYFARCTEIYSADLVSEPAANPSGLFQQATTQTQKLNMNEDQIKGIVEAALKAALEPVTARLSQLESAQLKPEQLSALSEKASETAATTALKAFSAQFGAPPAAPSAPASKPVEKKFEELVKEHPDYSKSRRSALAAVIKANPAAYADYNARVRSGEVVMF